MADGTVKCIENEIPFEVPDSWEWSRLSTLGTFAGGKTPSTANCNFWGGDVLWVTSKDMKTKYIDDTLIKMSDVGFKQMQLFPPDSLLMVVRSGILRWTFPLAILKAQATVNQDIKVCSLYLPFMAEYIYNYLKASELGILTHCSKSGTTVESVNVEDIKNLLIALPPFSEQSRIDDAISLAFTQIAMIESEKLNLQSIMTQTKSKILDLAIHGKLIPQDPNDEPASVLLERIRAEKEEQIKQGKIKRDKNESYIFRGDDKSYYEKVGDSVKNIDAEIMFEIPENWMWARLGACFNVVMGSSPSGNSITNNYDGMEFHQGKICFSQMWLQQSDMYTSEPSKVAPAGSVLLCVRAPVGTVNITDREICIGRGLASISPACKMTSLFAYYWISTLQGDFIKKATGSTFIAITADTVKEQLVPMPPLAEQLKIVDIIECLYKQSNAIMESL